MIVHDSCLKFSKKTRFFSGANKALAHPTVRGPPPLNVVRARKLKKLRWLRRGFCGGTGRTGFGRVGRVGQICPAVERDGFRYGHPACSYSSDVAAKAAKHGKAPASPAAQICPAAERDGFKYGHPGCSYSDDVAAQAAKHGAFLVGRGGQICPVIIFARGVGGFVPFSGH